MESSSLLLFPEAVDFTFKLSNHIWILYRCPSCGAIPIRSNHWLRVFVRKKWRWVCAATYKEAGSCFARWCSGVSECVLVINRGYDFSEDVHYDVYRLGQMTQLDYDILSLLRSSKILTITHGVFSDEKLMDSLEELNSKYDGQLKTYSECRSVKSCTYAQVRDRFPSLDLFCENPSLSVACGNMIYKCLFIDGQKEAMSQVFCSLVVECLCAHFDLNAVKPLGKKSSYKWRVWHAAHRASYNWFSTSISEKKLIAALDMLNIDCDSKLNHFAESNDKKLIAALEKLNFDCDSKLKHCGESRNI